MLRNALLDHPLFGATVAAYAAAVAAYLAAIRWRESTAARLSTGSIALAAALNLTLFAERWVEAGRPPLKTLHEKIGRAHV